MQGEELARLYLSFLSRLQSGYYYTSVSDFFQVQLRRVCRLCAQDCRRLQFSECFKLFLSMSSFAAFHLNIFFELLIGCSLCAMKSLTREADFSSETLFKTPPDTCEDKSGERIGSLARNGFLHQPAEAVSPTPESLVMSPINTLQQVGSLFKTSMSSMDTAVCSVSYAGTLQINAGRTKKWRKTSNFESHRL